MWKIYLIGCLIPLLVSSSLLAEDSLLTQIKLCINCENEVELLESFSKDCINNKTPATCQNAASVFLESQRSKSSKFFGHWLQSEAYIKLSNADSSRVSLKKAKLFCQENKRLLSLLYNTEARIYDLEGQFRQAITSSLKSIEFSANTDARCIRIGNLSVFYSKNNQPKESVKVLHQALQCAEAFQNHATLSFLNYLLGNVYMEIGKYKKAKQYFEESSKQSEQANDLNMKAAINRSLGSLMTVQGIYRTAISYHKKALSYYEENGPNTYELDVLNSIALNYQRDGLGIKGIPFAKRAIKIAQKIEHETAEIFVQITLLSCYTNAKKFEEAEKTLVYLKKKMDKDWLYTKEYVTLLGNEIEIAESNGNFKQMALAYKAFFNSQDSLDKLEFKDKVVEIETKFQTEKKEKENLRLRAEKEIQSGRMKLLGGGMSALLLSLGVFTFYYRRNQKQKDKIVTLQKELHHRVNNNLAIIDEFIDKSMENVSDKKTVKNLSELQSRVGSINEVHTLLHQTDDITVINIKEYLQALSTRIQFIYDKQDVQICIDCDKSLQLDTSQSVHFGLLVNEFLTNSFKYAFGGIVNPRIDISVILINGELALVMKDNGVGFKQEEISNSSYGTHIMELLAKKMKASYSLSGIDGTVLNLRLVNT